MAIRKDFGFIGRLCLDFAQTGDMGWGKQFERLTTPAELQRWMLVSPFGFPRVRIRPADLSLAKILRSAIWRIAVAIIARKKPSVADISLVNRVACRANLARELTSGAEAIRWHRSSIGKALGTIAQDAVMLFGDPEQKKRLRRCGNSGCRVIFYDDSRPGLRRWCAANRCGDRIRARAYRKRHAN